MAYLLFFLAVTALCYSPHLSLYKNTSAIYSQLQDLRNSHPELIKINQCSQDNGIWYTQFGDATRSVKGIITCGVHARELITSDTCMNILNQIVKEKQKYNDLYLVVVPVVNKNRQAVLRGNTCIRVNQMGVDPNRNFPTDFEHGEDDKKSQTYHGPYPLSEKSSQCIDSILTTHRWNLFADVHTGQFSIFYSQRPGNPHNRQTLEIANSIKREDCPNCISTTVMKQMGRIAGEMFQDASYRYKVDHAFLFEMFGGKMSKQLVGSKSACLKQFSPNSVKIRDYYINKWTKIIIKKVIDKVIKLKEGARALQ